jgi:hypothetical protein
VDSWSPVLSVRELGHGCRLSLAGIAYADGATLQQAAERLIARVLDAAEALESGIPFSPAMPPPPAGVLRFLHDIRQRAARREDVRGLILGGSHDTPA